MTNDATVPPAESAAEVRARINAETAVISWSELQRFFAAGRLLWVATEEDLVDVAYEIAADNADQVGGWLEAGRIRRVSDAQAQSFHDQEAEFCAVVVRPWVLIQSRHRDSV